MSCDTLNLEQAANFLQLSQGVLRERARLGQIKAAKPGKRWVFLQTDLVDYLDELYAQSCAHVSGCKEKSLWQYGNETERGGLTSEVRVEREYAALLRPQTGH